MVTLLTELVEIELKLLVENAKKKFSEVSHDQEIDVDAFQVGYDVAVNGMSHAMSSVLTSIKKLDSETFEAFMCGYRGGENQLEALATPPESD